MQPATSATWSQKDATLVRAQLRRMAGCPVFAQAGRMTALLEYLVESELEGSSDALNQYRIAIDVLGRDERFDPGADSIVRVEVGRLRNGRARSPAPDAPRQEVRYCRSADGTSIAYATAGEGYPLLKAANWLSHLEFDYQSPVWRHWWRDLGRRYRLIRYDERGCGLSDWDVSNFTFDAWVQDLTDVADAAAPERFPLLGMSQGAPVAIAYAAAHPERVSHLILYGGFARGPMKRGDPSYEERSKLLRQLTRVGWADRHHAFRQVFGLLFVPDATNEQIKWFDELQRVSTNAVNAEKFWEVCGEIDVSPLLERIEAPTLIIHSARDSLSPISETKALAAGIRGAKLTVLDSNNHILLEDEPAWPRFLEELDAFVAAH